jgi:hypothetical protein
VLLGESIPSVQDAAFNGRIDDVRLYDCVLSDDEIAVLAGVGEVAPVEFIRGDCNGDGAVSGQVTDAAFLLNHSFAGGPAPPCLAACDADGDGGVTGRVTDAIYLLNFNFLGGAPPLPPFPGCGPGQLRSDEELGCESPPQACS